MGIRAAFQRFVEVQDPEAALAGASVKAWIGSTLFVVLLVLGVGFTPGISGFFQLQWKTALLVYGAVLVVIATYHVVLRLDGGLTDRVWVLYIVGNSTTQFFTASLASLSSPNGGPIFATLYLFTAAYHAQWHRAGPREPFLAIGTGLAAVGAWALAPTAANASLFTVVGPTAVLVSLLAGYYGQKAMQMKLEAGKLRSAVQAQILSDRDRELEALRQDLVGVLATNHDVNNALTALVLDAETLVAITDQSRSRDTAEIARGLADSLRRVLGLLGSTRPATRTLGAREGYEPTPLRPVVNAVIKAASARHPRVKVSSEFLLSGDVEVVVMGGASSLQRVVENLVVNACEGDGVTGAGVVRLSAVFDASGAVVRISVVDDGPGFPSEVLGRSVEGFRTTKPNGTGLGLYTVGKLVHASGGSLARRNLNGGGAEVEVMLPVAQSRLDEAKVSDQAAA